MRDDFGTKEIRENDPFLKGFVNLRKPTRALRRVDYLIEKAGIGLIQVVEKYYGAYLEKPTPANAKKYALWRFRLHKRLKNNRAVLEEINEARNLGLNDIGPGRLCWDYNFEG